MSRPALLGGALLLTLAAAGLPAQVQRPANDRARQFQVKADSLARLWEEATALANLADSLAHGDSPSHLDTVRVGSLVIISNRSPLPLQAAAERAWPLIDSLYGSAAGQLAERPYLIHATDPDSQVRSYATWGTLIPWDKTVKETTDLLWVYVPMRPADLAYQSWAGAIVRPSTRGTRADLEQSYVGLVTSHYQAARDCFLGSIEACRSVLDLDDPVDPIRVFRTPAERKEAVKGMEAGYVENDLRATLSRCAGGSDSTCVALFRTIQHSRLPVVVPVIAKQTLVTLALRIGGPEAYGRLMADSTAPMPRRLAAASGLPLDSLLQTWQAEVIGSRPKPVALPAYGPLVGLGWIVGFGLLALRSTRWRVA